MTADRDPAVGAVLDLLPVDPPPPGFWDDLQARLEGAEVVDLGAVPSAGRPHRRRVVAVALAAAVVLVAVVVGSALRDGRDDLDTGPVGPPPSGEGTETTRDPSGPERSSADQRAAAAMAAYIQDEDPDDIWALLGPQSRAAYGGDLTEQARGLLSSAREDINLWRTDDLAFTTVELADRAGLTTVIVTAHATVDDDPSGGPPTLRHWSLLAQDDGTTARLEPFVPGPALDLVELEYLDGIPVLVRGDVITVNVDADAAGVGVLLDGEPAPDDAVIPGDGGSPVGVRIPEDLHPGRHDLTVAMVAADGTLALATNTFELGAPAP